MNRKISSIVLLVVFGTAAMALWLKPGSFEAARLLSARLVPKRTVEDVLRELGSSARARFTNYFETAKVTYPPRQLSFLALKEQRELQVYADDRLITTYPILAASGGPGPKLREGDHQVPEGIYPIESLNPNSQFHLSLRVGYPNQQDRLMAIRDGRDNLGGDIMIHGSAVSVGCLAMGDPVAEELFVMVADCGIDQTEIVISPVDFRKVPDFTPPKSAPAWTAQRYFTIKAAIAKLPPPPNPAGVR